MEIQLQKTMLRIPNTLEVEGNADLEAKEWFTLLDGIDSALTALGLSYKDMSSQEKGAIVIVHGLRIAD